MNVVEEIGRVLEIEIEALQSVRRNLNAEFEKAVDVMSSCSGRVFVTGIGKSGMIANKIAATLTSTGTPAIFLHASDAMHGDIGTVRTGDVVLALSKSGEIVELNALVRSLKKEGIPIVSITSNADSAMALLSDVVLRLDIPKEACPLNLAPTASTTAALAVGDALAVTLMKQNNITEEDFARNHPGGQIGRRLLLTVGDIMRSGENNPVIGIDMPLREMLVRITSFRVGAISIIDERGRLEGLVTDYDIRRALESGNDFLDRHISDVMNASPETILAEIKAIEALEMMRGFDKPIAVLPVVDSESRAIGMIHLHDLIAAGL